MKLYRGVRHPDGRVDVSVSTPDGTAWLRAADGKVAYKRLGYGWGEDSPGSLMLALDLLTDTLGNEEIASDFMEAFMDEMLLTVAADRWALPTWEITAWFVREADNRIQALRALRKGGPPPCPSEN